MNGKDIFTGERFIPGIDDDKLEVEHYQRYLSVRELVRGKAVLDAACGEGYGSNLMASAAKRVTGLDIDEDTIKRAKETYKARRNLEFLQGSIENIPLEDASVDVVVSFETIEHVPEAVQYKFLGEIARVLKPDGMLVMSTPNKRIYSDLYEYKNEFHIKEFYHDEFIALLKLKFKHVKLFNQAFEIASIVTSCGGGEDKVAYFARREGYSQDGKYYIAVASNKPMDAGGLASVYLSAPGEYDRNVQRIISLQEEEKARNEHIARLDEEAAQAGENIRRLQTENEERNAHIRRLDLQIEEKDQLIRDNAESLAAQQGEIERQQREIEARRSRETELEGEVEEQQGRIARLEGEAEEQQNRIAGQQNEIEKQGMHIAELERQREALNGEIRILQEEIAGKNHRLEDYASLESELRQIILNKTGHIELLLEVERAYEREKNTHSYKFGKKVQRIGDFMLPPNSRRRFFARILVNIFRHPGLMLHVVNPKRIKNYMKYMKREGIEGVNRRYEEAVSIEKSRLNHADSLKLEVVKPEESGMDGGISVQKSASEYEKLTLPVWGSPLVSIVIPVYNQFEYTYNCVKSIIRNSGDITYEVIIANDCSTDITQKIDEIIANIRVITTKENVRFLLNCNNAAQYAKGEYILFLNNDTQVQDNWLKPLVELIEGDSQIGMVGSKLIYPDGLLQEAGGIVWKDASAWNYGYRQNPNESEFNYVHETDYISGAAIMIKSALWKEIGGFDERFAPAYCEDSDLAFEVRRHGYKVVYQPKSVVVHFEGISNGTDVNSGLKKYQVENREKLYEKWKEVLEKEHFENGTNVMPARERSGGLKHVLVIDHYVPQYDKDAGSKTTLMYLKMLVKKGYKVTFLGDNFYQDEPYTTILQQMGIFVLYGAYYAQHWKEWLEENISYYDVFYLNRPHISIKYIDFIKKHAKGKVIYYGHDLHFLRLQREYEISGNAKILEEAANWKKQELYLMHKADMNYYPSNVEVEEIHKIDSAIPVKAITAYVYDKFPDIEYVPDKREGILFVGGFGHPPNLDAVLWFVKEIYPEVYRRTGAAFYIVGSNPPKEITQLEIEGVVVKGFVTEEELKGLYGSCRLAAVPLRYGAGVKGKVVEALYYGMPIVTTSVGAEGIPGIEAAVIVEDDAAAMADSICRLYGDYARLQELSRKSGEFVRRYFSMEAVWEGIREDFA